MKKFVLPKYDYEALKVESECSEGLGGYSGTLNFFAIITLIIDIIIGLIAGAGSGHIILGILLGALVALPTYLVLKFFSLEIQALKEIVENLNVLNKAYIYNNIKNDYVAGKDANEMNKDTNQNEDNKDPIDVEIVDNNIACPICTAANYPSATKCRYCGQPFNVINRK